MLFSIKQHEPVNDDLVIEPCRIAWKVSMSDHGVKIFVMTKSVSLVNATEALQNKEDMKEIIGHWSFDDDITGYPIKNPMNSRDSIYGKSAYVDGVKGKALSFDGFRTYIKSSGLDHQNQAKEFTVEAWIAPAMYPWSQSPVFDCTDVRGRGFFFGIDELGRVAFKVAAGNSWYEARSES